MLKISSIKRDIAKENEGDWVSIVEWPGVRLKVRSISSKDYQTAREMLVGKLSRSLGRVPTSPEMEPALGKLIATHLLRGWEGIAGDDDKPLEYTPKVALDLLADPSMRELEQQVIWAANRVGDREAEFTADAVKKLRRAFRYDLERKGTDEFLQELVEEEPDAAALFAGREEELDRPDDAQWPAWSGYIKAAWDVLRHDRFYGAMGGIGPVYFEAKNAYARRYDIRESAFDDFLIFFGVLDDEYMAHVSEKQKAEQAKNKQT